MSVGVIAPNCPLFCGESTNGCQVVLSGSSPHDQAVTTLGVKNAASVALRIDEITVPVRHPDLQLLASAQRPGAARLRAGYRLRRRRYSHNDTAVVHSPPVSASFLQCQSTCSSCCSSVANFFQQVAIDPRTIAAISQLACPISISPLGSVAPPY